MKSPGRRALPGAAAQGQEEREAAIPWPPASLCGQWRYELWLSVLLQARYRTQLEETLP